MSNSRLEILFHKYYEGLATTQEINELMVAIDKSTSDESLLIMLRDAWNSLEGNEKVFSQQQSARMLERIMPNINDHMRSRKWDMVKSQVHWTRKWYWVAAAVLVPILVTVWWGLSRHGDERNNSREASQHSILAGTSKAELTLDDGSVVRLGNAGDEIVSDGTRPIAKTDKGHITYLAGGSQKESLRLSTLATPKGGQYQLTLSDGTRVWLNAASSIRFPTAFAANERKVEVEGEVFFEVYKEQNRPFRVLFGQNEINVLGTSFNVEHYPDEPISKTTLVEGSVSLNTNGKQAVMKPGQGASIGKTGSVHIGEVDVDEAIAWKDGYFNFQDSDIKEVMRQVSRWYDVEVIYEGKVNRKRFTGRVSRNENISELMAMLRYAGLNCETEGRKIRILN